MRCSLARTLTLQPPIMLFDEPFGAVDEITRERLNEETLRLFEDQRFAGLFITHSISEAVFLSTPSPRDVAAARSASSPRSKCHSPIPAIPICASTRASSAISAEISHACGLSRRERAPDPGETQARRTRGRRGSARPPRARRSLSARLTAAVVPPLVDARLVIGMWYFVSYVVLERRRQFLFHPPHDVVQKGSSTATTSPRSSTACGRACAWRPSA